MSHPVSIRFRDDGVVKRLQAEAATRRASTSALAEELIDEGLRARRHPGIRFLDGATGRRANLVGGPDVWEIVGGIVGGDVPVEDRIERAARVFGLRPDQLDAALAYYAEFTEEIDSEINANHRVAEEAEALWRRRRDLLAK